MQRGIPPAQGKWVRFGAVPPPSPSPIFTLRPMSALLALLRRGALPARACAWCACACAYGGGGGVAAPASFQAPASIGWFSSAGGAHGGGGVPRTGD